MLDRRCSICDSAKRHLSFFTISPRDMPLNLKRNRRWTDRPPPGVLVLTIFDLLANRGSKTIVRVTSGRRSAKRRRSLLCDTVTRDVCSRKINFLKRLIMIDTTRCFLTRATTAGSISLFFKIALSLLITIYVPGYSPVRTVAKRPPVTSVSHLIKYFYSVRYRPFVFYWCK